MPGEILHAVIVSYRRLPMLKACVESFVATCSIPYTLRIVDNASPLDVIDWIVRERERLGYLYTLVQQNRYPGYATNLGWEAAPPNATLLMRSDNDSIWLPGWCDEMIAAFEDPTVGQYGPIAEGDEPWASMECWPVGGNSIIRRSLYDAGLRYDETPWPAARIQEDHALFEAVIQMGYRRVFGTRPGLIYNGMRDPEYDAEVARARGKPWP